MHSTRWVCTLSASEEVNGGSTTNADDAAIGTSTTTTEGVEGITTSITINTNTSSSDTTSYYYISDLSAVDARWMALQLAPRDTTLYKYALSEMQRDERRRLRLAQHALEYADIDEAEEFVKIYCADRGVLCHVPMLQRETNEVMYFDANDVGAFVTELTRGADPSTLTVFLEYYMWRLWRICELGSLASMATQPTTTTDTPPDHNEPSMRRARICLFELLYGRVESWCGGDESCLLYTSDAADEEDSVDLGGRRIIKKKKKIGKKTGVGNIYR
eukprot:TRINITY_DN6205_c0_g1_i1.p1 TRINITY_DN6205_c0_g1~~TRINITY_DN6205_c0_g1_i1.p1  ORF type:complete len:274 (-),score=49.69 TRINITY_DN6205_c0_g1_i1:54-875(-)